MRYRKKLLESNVGLMRINEKLWISSHEHFREQIAASIVTESAMGCAHNLVLGTSDEQNPSIVLVELIGNVEIQMFADRGTHQALDGLRHSLYGQRKHIVECRIQDLQIYLFKQFAPLQYNRVCITYVYQSHIVKNKT